MSSKNEMDDEMLQLGRQMDERAEQNRLAALARKKVLHQQRQVLLATLSTSDPIISDKQRVRMEENRQKALEKKKQSTNANASRVCGFSSSTATFAFASMHPTSESSSSIATSTSATVRGMSSMDGFVSMGVIGKKPRMQATEKKMSSTNDEASVKNDDELLQLGPVLSIHQTSTLPSGEGVSVSNATAEIISLDVSKHDDTGATEIISLLDDSNHTVASSGGEGGDENVPWGNLKDDRDYIPSAAATATTRSRSSSTVPTTSNALLQIVPYNSVYSSNLFDEEAEEEEYEAQEQLTEDEIDQLADVAQRNLKSNITSGLFSSKLVPEHKNDVDLVFDQVQYRLQAVMLWNALTKFEQAQFGIRNPAKPFYIISGEEAMAAFDHLSPDAIEKLDIDVLLSKVGVLAKAMQLCRGDNSVYKLCGGGHHQLNNIDGVKFVRGNLFLLVSVNCTAADETRFVNCQEVEGGLEKIANLRLRVVLMGASVPLQILVSMNGEIIHKYTSKGEVVKDLMLAHDALSSNAMRSEQGLNVDIRHTNTGNSQRPADNQNAPLIMNFKIFKGSFDRFLAMPMATVCEEQYKRMMNQPIIALCKPEVRIQQLGETYTFANVLAVKKWARGNGKGKFIAYRVKHGEVSVELYTRDIVNAGPTGLVTVREKGIPRGKSGRWTWTLTGILTHTNNSTKVVRKFKKGHDGNYYKVNAIAGEESHNNHQ